MGSCEGGSERAYGNTEQVQEMTGVVRIRL